MTLTGLTAPPRGSGVPGASPVRRIVLIHGAATTAETFGTLAAALADRYEIVTPQRRYTGDWQTEITELATVCAGAVVVGVSGGATLGLELALRGVPIAGAVLHEPAAGSLSPHLLDPMIAALRYGGPAAFGHALYGPTWNPDMLPSDDDGSVEGAVTRDLAMFRGFEPRSVPGGLPDVLLTVGALSPPIRHESVAAVAEVVGARTAQVPGGGHAVHLDAVAAFADVIAACVRALRPAARSVDAARARTSTKGT